MMTKRRSRTGMLVGLVVGACLLCAPASAFAQAGFSVSPSFGHNFGNQAVGTNSVAQTFTVTSTDAADLTIASIGLTGGTPDQFEILNDTCTGVNLPTSGQCTVQVRFKPTSALAKTTNLRFNHNAPDSPSELGLEGSGIVSGFSVSPSFGHNFGNQAVGTNSVAQTFTVTSTDAADLTIASIGLTGGTPDQFEILNDTCTGVNLPTSGQCTVQVRFKPTSALAKTTNLRFNHNAPDSPSELGLEGSGIVSGFSVSPSFGHNFGNQAVGTNSVAQTFTVTSTDAADLTIASIGLTGGTPDQFEILNDTCTGVNLPTSGQCTVQVRFKPTSALAKTTNLRFNHNAPDSPSELGLEGAGAPVPAAGFSVAPNPKGYGDQVAGTSSGPQTFTVTNPGTTGLSIAGVALTTGTASEFELLNDTCSGATVAPNQSCTVQVRFSPLTTGPKGALLRFTHDAPGSPSDVGLTGQGTVFVAAPSEPDTTIDSGPPPISLDPGATFAFSSDGPGASFECSLDAAQFEACVSPLTLNGLDAGRHTLQVRALNGGLSDPTPASFSFTVVASCDGSTPTLLSTGNVPLVGTADDDVIVALSGTAKIDGGSGNDSICVVEGKHTIKGGKGNDFIALGDEGGTASGGSGADTLVGGDGADRLIGGAGRDKLVGGKGNDTLAGGGGPDALGAGPGKDKCNGGPALDTGGGSCEVEVAIP